MFSRRSFLTRSGLAAAAATVSGAPHIARSAEVLLSTPGQKPNRIIHLVSDGMSSGTLTCADLFSQLTRNRPLTWTQLFRNPLARLAMMNTRSLNSMVTDSSAASSAWGSGSRVVNGTVNILPDGKLLTPLYALFADAGWKTGLVTTAEITHATPAGFAAAIKSRGNSDAIAVQYLDRRIDVLLGGGSPFFDPKKRKDKRDLRADFAAAGYTVVHDRATLIASPVDTRLLGTFAEGHLPYTLDRRHNLKLDETVPSLSRMTRIALERLGRSEKFILQIEGARIDHAAHNSDAAAALHDQIALDQALDVCLEFQQKHPDTLIVVTTDHANSNLGLTGMGGGYRTSSQRFATTRNARMSFPEILSRLEKAGEKLKVPSLVPDVEDKLEVEDPMAKVDPDGKSEEEREKEEREKKEKKEEREKKKANEEKKKTDDEKTKFTAAVQTSSAFKVEPKAIIDIIADATGYRMSTRRAALFAKVLAGETNQLFDQMNSVATQLGQALANHNGMGWTGNTHTADYVSLIAIGPGSERFAGFVENTDIFHHYTSFAGIDFKNPTNPRIAAAGPEADEAERSSRYSRVV
ncbi:MAG: alkaline phosphatase [Verrucomicrobiota bacterium]